MTAQRLFISHAHADEAVVKRIVAYLEAHGVPCWLSSRDIPPRTIYADAIVQGMQASSACVVIMSDAANESKAVKRELELASHYDKPFIPIRIDSAEPGPGYDYYLRNTQWVDYRRDGEAALNRISGQVGQSPPPITPRARARAVRNRTVIIGAATLALAGTAAAFGWLAWPHLMPAKPAQAPQQASTELTLDQGEIRADRSNREDVARLDDLDDDEPAAARSVRQPSPNSSPAVALTQPVSSASRAAIPEQWRAVISEANAVAARGEQAAGRARDRESAARRWAIQAQRATPGVRTVTTARGTYSGQTEAIALTFRPHGLGVLAHSPPRGQRIGGVAAGQWEHGALLSPAVIEFVDERGVRTRYEGEVEDDRPHGAGVLTLADGRQLFGSFERGQLNGLGRQSSPQGTTYYGNFENGRRNGRGIAVALDDSIRESGSWRDDQLVSP